ncbi:MULTISPECIES: hypothetical protein [unclassified Sphingomonas]|uniref:hypothetical protein n=1 Tax=unclassified Sphingomonas TaxID=196159 RepID=UPI00226A19E4|nr:MULTISPECIES: hypothetical protein [unclassified Sphingomonas]
MTSTRSMEGKGLHFPPSLATDADGVILPAPAGVLPTIAAAVEPSELLYFAQRLIRGARRRRRQPRWSAVNAQRMELAQLCLARALIEPIGRDPLAA